MFNATVLDYNAFDAINTLEVDENVSEFMGEQYDFQYKMAVDLIPPLMFMMSRGVVVDFDRLQDTKIEANKRIASKQEQLNTLAGKELNVNSAKQLKEYFYITKGIHPYTKRNGKGGTSITCDDKALQRIARGTAARKGLYEAKLIQEIRGLIKLVGTYLDLTLDEDKRFRCSYNPVGTKFGRLSSSKTIFGTGMNMQNLPLEFKQFLIADPGQMMWEIDKAKAEWVVVAYLSGDPNMIKVIEEGLDPHIHTAHLMTGLPKDFIAMEEALIGHTTNPDDIAEARNKIMKASAADRHLLESAKFLPRTMPIRQCGKKANHGLNYDEGYKTFALTNEMPEGDAKKVVQLYRVVAYPGIPTWHKSIQSKLRHDRTLHNCFGRTYKFLGAWDDNLFKAAYAFIPQSTVADLVNMGIVDAYNDRTASMKILEMLGQVHDSIMGQHEYSNLDRMACALQRTAAYMNQDMEYGGRVFTIDNDLKVGLAWSTLQDVDINASQLELRRQLERVKNELWP